MQRLIADGAKISRSRNLLNRRPGLLQRQADLHLELGAHQDFTTLVLELELGPDPDFLG